MGIIQELNGKPEEDVRQEVVETCPCFTCRGTGRVHYMITVDDSDDEPCLDCDGTGECHENVHDASGM